MDPRGNNNWESLYILTAKMSRQFPKLTRAYYAEPWGNLNGAFRLKIRAGKVQVRPAMPIRIPQVLNGKVGEAHIPGLDVAAPQRPLVVSLEFPSSLDVQSSMQKPRQLRERRQRRRNDEQQGQDRSGPSSPMPRIFE